MKKITFWKSLFLLFALIVGSSSAWGQSERTITINYNSTFSPALPSSTGNSSVTAHTVEGLAIKEKSIYKGTSASYMMFVSGAGYLYNTADLGTINSVAVTYSSGTSTSAKSGVYFGSSEQSTYTTTSNATIKGQSGTDTWSNSTSGNGFFQLSTSNKNCQITKIVIKYTPPAAPSLSVNAGDFNAAFDLTITAATGRTLKYTTDGTEPSTSETATSVNSNSTTVNIPAATTRIRAISIKDNITSTEADATYTYVNASAPNITVSGNALDFGEVEVGNVKELTFIVTPANLTGALTIASNNAKYTISPTSIAQDVTTAQTITVTAAPTAYNDDMDGTITISGGGITAKEVSLTTTPYEVSNVSLVASNDLGSFKVGDDVVTEITSRVGNAVTVKAIPNNGYKFSSWTATGATPASSEDAETEFTLTGTAVTLTANFEDDPCSYTTLTSSDIQNLSGTLGYDNVKTVTVDGLTWKTTGYKQTATNEFIQLKSGTPYIQLPELPGYIQTITFTVTNASASSKTGTAPTTSFMFRTAASGSNIVTTGNEGNTIIIDLSGKEEQYTTGYIFSSAGARVWEITIAYIIPTTTITAAGYGTYVTPANIDFANTEGVTAYKVTAANATTITMESIDAAPKGTPVIIKADADTYTLAMATTAPAAITDNLLQVSDGTLKGSDKPDGKTIYVLGKKGDKVGFGYLAESTTLAAGKAYLLIDTSATDAKSFIAFDDTATGIANVDVNDNVDANAPMYNLAGQRVSKSYKGVVIVNGKKMLNK